ncbi:hypothetical protein EJ05DRAFT_1798 [Pseudovirgaria hyperparasitica]|uniref:Rad21/Rec8-like protein N-terminal domain-containing protein n=1 Tax=Pseudovirgaria hyperparasitica TaxID=470096 RepID=A0A6A6WI13_9PEZI|nr:uncharacterized protein EJ05DRAFT_1798 [Pseudovirgaria hyperparasitica]KAF2762438.1 hypothetical protein EJ05DRAFT_1798 [Pseudovirgaria hyperparasitica]
MFYSHEVLTSRKYGVATIWLVATLGSKSALKKVNRKAISKVDVAKACDTIKEPEAPMALRLQSSLLYVLSIVWRGQADEHRYGVVQVYSQQCQYVLLDAQNAYNSIRQFLKANQNVEIDATTVRARPDQLELADDPAFMPGLAQLPLDFDFMDLDMGIGMRSQSLSLMSPGPSMRSRQGSGPTVAGLIIPEGSSQMGRAGFQVRGDDGASAKQNDPSSIIRRDTMAGFDSEADFSFDAEGNMIDIEPVMPSTPTPNARRNLAAEHRSDAAVRQGYSDAGQPQDFMGSELPPLVEDMILPDAEPFPPRAQQATHEPASQGFVVDQEESSAASAPLRKRRTRKPIAADRELEVRNTELSRWNSDYNEIMILATTAKMPQKAIAQAKKNAEWLVLGRGIGGVGSGVGSHMVESPFNMYCGDSLWEMITGTKRREDKLRKRLRDPDVVDVEDTDSSEGRRVRARSEEGELRRGVEAQLGDQNELPPLGDDTIELPRDEREVLDDRRMSSAMPWNITASIRGSSVARGIDLGFPASAGLSIGGVSGSNNRQRLVSASPLQGRGSGALGPLSQYLEAGDDNAMPFESEPYDSASGGVQNLEPIAADAADAPYVTESQQLRDALDREGQNFLEFIEQGIREKAAGNAEEDMVHDDDHEDEITFEKLLPTHANNRLVAANAFLHVLSLATKNLIYVRQSEAYGDIGLGLVEPIV